jgi:hypothetical protein
MYNGGYSFLLLKEKKQEQAHNEDEQDYRS